MVESLFEKTVDVILEGVTAFEPAIAKKQELSDAEGVVDSIKADLRHEIDSLGSQLALEIRRKLSKLTARQNSDGSISIAYGRGNNTLTLKPNVEAQSFEVGSTAFDRRFRRYHGHKLEAELGIIADAVVAFFKQSYRSIK